jgi:hypothetical protein
MLFATTMPSVSVTVKHSGAPEPARRQALLAAEPCKYNVSSTTPWPIGMQYGWPSWTKARWPNSASCRIASAPARS